MKKALTILLVLGILTAIFFIARYFVNKSKDGTATDKNSGIAPGTIVGQPISETTELIETDFSEIQKTQGTTQNSENIQELINSDIAFKTGDADSSDFAFMELR